jgi:hypothetical protein
MSSQPPHTDSRGHVFIPHPEGSGGLKCNVLCIPMSDGTRHVPDCPTVAAWKEALSTTLVPAVRSDRDRLMAKEPGCGACGHVAARTAPYVLIQYGGILRPEFNLDTASHFEVNRRDDGTVSVWCTHGAWGAVMVFDEDGKATQLRHGMSVDPIPVVGIEPTFKPIKFWRELANKPEPACDLFRIKTAPWRLPDGKAHR